MQDICAHKLFVPISVLISGVATIVSTTAMVVWCVAGVKADMIGRIDELDRKLTVVVQALQDNKIDVVASNYSHK